MGCGGKIVVSVPSVKVGCGLSVAALDIVLRHRYCRHQIIPATTGDGGRKSPIKHMFGAIPQYVDRLYVADSEFVGNKHALQCTQNIAHVRRAPSFDAAQFVCCFLHHSREHLMHQWCGFARRCCFDHAGTLTYTWIFWNQCAKRKKLSDMRMPVDNTACTRMQVEQRSVVSHKPIKHGRFRWRVHHLGHIDELVRSIL